MYQNWEKKFWPPFNTLLANYCSLCNTLKHSDRTEHFFEKRAVRGRNRLSPRPSRPSGGRTRRTRGKCVSHLRHQLESYDRFYGLDVDILLKSPHFSLRRAGRWRVAAVATSTRRPRRARIRRATHATEEETSIQWVDFWDDGNLIAHFIYTNHRPYPLEAGRVQNPREP